MRIKSLLLAPVAALAMAPVSSFAADFPVTISIEAVIPAAEGLQVATVGGWDAITQAMGWDLARQELKPINQEMDMKSNAAIEGYLTSAASLTSGSNSLPLTVAVNGKVLQAGAAAKTTILTETEAQASRRVGVDIKATKPTDGYVEGNYAGQVYMMFESTP